MDDYHRDKVCHLVGNSFQPPLPGRSHSSQLDCRNESEEKDPVNLKKVQKADRERLRRDRLNEHFSELGNTLDPDRPKNDKATILTDTVQLLKDLTTEVNKLKAECAALTEESHELTLEKNELREEKASLKADIENCNIEYQQRLRAMYPWPPVEPSVVMGPPYSYPLTIAVPPGPMPMHPSMQPYPIYGGQNPSAIPNPCPAFIPYPNPSHPHTDQQPAHHASVSHVSSKPHSKTGASESRKRRHSERTNDSNDVVTELELKTPGSVTQQKPSSDGKGKQSYRVEKSATGEARRVDTLLVKDLRRVLPVVSITSENPTNEEHLGSLLSASH